MSTAPSRIPPTDIIFDLGKVLVPFDWDIAFRRLILHVPEDIGRLVVEDRKTFMVNLALPCKQLECGQITFEQFFVKIREITGLDASLEAFRDIWCDIFWLNDELVKIGSKLTQNYSCWLMSNTSEAHYRWITTRFPSIEFYRKAALSYELGHMKPDRQYYEKALELFGIDPLKAVFIDDIQENLDGASLFGIRTIKYETNESLIRLLSDYGVEV